MISILSNSYFYLLLILTYVAIVIVSARFLNVFAKINNLKLTLIIKSKLNDLKLIRNLKDFVKNKIIAILRNTFSKLKEWVFAPIINKTLFALEAISDNLINAELKSSHEVSKSFEEIFTYLSLILRKAVEAEIQINWSVVFVFIVLIYFILTMQ